MRLVDADRLKEELTMNFAGEPLHGNTKIAVAEIRRVIDMLTNYFDVAEDIGKAIAERDAAISDINSILHAEDMSSAVCRICDKSKNGKHCDNLLLENFTCKANAEYRGIKVKKNEL